MPKRKISSTSITHRPTTRPNPTAPPPPQIEAEYDYHGEIAELHRKLDRIEAKIDWIGRVAERIAQHLSCDLTGTEAPAPIPIPLRLTEDGARPPAPADSDATDAD